MKKLSNNVYDYYLTHIADLSERAQFHLASRIYLWDQDVLAQALVLNMRSMYTHKENPQQAIKQAIDEGRDYFNGRVINAMAIRQPYFTIYPELLPCISALFRILFLWSVYGIDAKALFYTHFEKSVVDTMRSTLLADPAAIAALSTHAINFLYLYDRVITNNETDLSVEAFLTIGSRYDLSTSETRLLLLYLYTHCIIADSLFYSRIVPEQNLSHYQRMIDELEVIIDAHYNDINLDSKFEFLVASQLIGHASPLRQRILAEADRSISSEGCFLVDRHNSSTQADRSSFEKSEHRNALFMMADRQFTPLQV